MWFIIVFSVGFGSCSTLLEQAKEVSLHLQNNQVGFIFSFSFAWELKKFKVFFLLHRMWMWEEIGSCSFSSFKWINSVPVSSNRYSKIHPFSFSDGLLKGAVHWKQKSVLMERWAQWSHTSCCIPGWGCCQSCDPGGGWHPQVLALSGRFDDRQALTSWCFVED